MKHPLSLYLDESGEQLWPSNRAKRDPICLWAQVGGVLVEPGQVDDIQYFNSQLLEFISSRVGRGVEWIHMTDLMKREKAYRGLSTPDAALCLEKSVKFLESKKIRIVGARNNLSNLEKRRGRRDLPYLCTVETALMQVDLLCRNRDSTFRACLATGNQVAQRDILEFVTRVRSETRIGPSGVPLEGHRLERLTDGVLFGEPRHSACLQLADTVAWLLKRDDTLYRQRLHPLWLINPFDVPAARAPWSDGVALQHIAEGKTHVEF
jgi:hypothetical protein